MPSAVARAAAAALAASCALAEPASAFVPPATPRSSSGGAAAAAPFVNGGSAHRPTLSVVAMSSSTKDKSSVDDDGTVVQEYRNAVTEVLSNFMQKDDDMDNAAAGKDGETGEGGEGTNPLSTIDFDAPKFRKVDLETLAEILDYELSNKEWFVTGNVNPVYFSDDFRFQDPDVKVDGIEDYAKGVRKLFDQQTSRAEIISAEVNPAIGPNTITVKWRLSGKVKIGPGLNIKPYICYTDFTVSEESGLITFQEDRFDIPGWDILLSALFPFLIGTPLVKDPAPEVEGRAVPVPAALMSSGKRSGREGNNEEGGPLGKIFSFFGGSN